MINSLFNNPLYFFISLAVIIASIAIHEFSHAFAAEKLGDPTPRLQGRLTLNPLVHIDPIGILLLVVMGFGWGKPVQFDSFNLKDPRRDAAIISIAGPASNFIIAMVCSIFLFTIRYLKLEFMGIIGSNILLLMLSINVTLGVFNLIPVHPLDGFKIVGGILPHEQAMRWFSLQRYGMIFLLVIILPLFGRTTMLDIFFRPVTSFILNILIPS